MRIPMLSGLTPFCRRATAACIAMPLALQVCPVSESGAQGLRIGLETLAMPQNKRHKAVDQSPVDC